MDFYVIIGKHNYKYTFQAVSKAISIRYIGYFVFIHLFFYFGKASLCIEYIQLLFQNLLKDFLKLIIHEKLVIGKSCHSLAQNRLV